MRRKPWWKSKKIWVLLGTLICKVFGQGAGLDDATIDSVSTIAFSYVGLEAGMDTVETLGTAIAERDKK